MGQRVGTVNSNLKAEIFKYTGLIYMIPKCTGFG